MGRLPDLTRLEVAVLVSHLAIILILVVFGLVLIDPLLPIEIALIPLLIATLLGAALLPWWRGYGRPTRVLNGLFAGLLAFYFVLLGLWRLPLDWVIVLIVLFTCSAFAAVKGHGRGWVRREWYESPPAQQRSN